MTSTLLDLGDRDVDFGPVNLDDPHAFAHAVWLGMSSADDRILRWTPGEHAAYAAARTAADRHGALLPRPERPPRSTHADG